MAQSGMFFKSFNIFALNSSFRKLQINLTNLTMNMRTSTREKLKELNIPDKPKRPLNPFARFVQDSQSTLHSKYPSWGQAQIFKQAAENWKHVSEAEKQRLQENYKDDKQIYDKKILEYFAKLTPVQKEFLEAVREEKEKDKVARENKKLCKETNKPKRPKTPYMTYILEQSKMRNVALKELMRTCKDEWHNMSKDEKEKYSLQFKREKEQYEAAMKKWEDKMIKEGHEDLVRLKSLEAKTSQEANDDHWKPAKSRNERKT